MRPLAHYFALSTSLYVLTSRSSLYLNLNIDILSKAMEDFNLPSPERITLLESLQEAIGGAPLHFWAACQICDLKALERLVKCGREYPEILRGFTQQTCTMAYYCK
jgi:hypothetical protein